MHCHWTPEVNCKKIAAVIRNLQRLYILCIKTLTELFKGAPPIACFTVMGLKTMSPFESQLNSCGVCFIPRVPVLLLKRILNVLIAEALRDKLFTTGSVKRVLNWSITPLFCTIVLLMDQFYFCKCSSIPQVCIYFFHHWHKTLITFDSVYMHCFHRLLIINKAICRLSSRVRH
jgi:hypothetical protein